VVCSTVSPGLFATIVTHYFGKHWLAFGMDRHGRGVIVKDSSHLPEGGGQLKVLVPTNQL
jgi:hypothetical protein